MKDKNIINMENYNRLNHFEYFKSMAYPYVGITSDVDITEFYNWVKYKNHPFFLSFLWCVARAANLTKEFRQRIENEGIVEYKKCNTSHTVAKDDGTYSYCTLECDKEFDDFLDYAVEKQKIAKNNGNIEEDKDKVLSLIFITTLPWMTYTSLIQPVPSPSDSNPRISWGKYYKSGECVKMPVSVLCHHAIVDGLHISNFYANLNDVMSEVSKTR